ncbi:HD-GYP domain-containing protein [Radiobacillus sp. PE A8.2]|uniref:HD-GYP domain-containing protein n=1 Tax=Radiobacillus sp. PE A8.2 TaxID=3380349 RepID=UPI003890FA0B
MQKKNINSVALLNEEKYAARLFLILFYTISIGYEIYELFLGQFLVYGADEVVSQGVTYGIYIILLGLLPIAIYFFNKDNPGLIKYIYFITYTAIIFVNDIILYWGNSDSYYVGSITEIFFILFTPIFVNNKYFFTVLIGTLLKYSLVGIILQTTNVIAPISIIAVISIFTYIILIRFHKYVNAIKDSYDVQIEGIVRGVVETLELKDRYTRGHSQRVAKYSIIFAKNLGKFSELDLRSLNFACLLHDIGKANIPDYILTKPGKLTDEEFEIIKSHPVIGSKVVTNIEGLQNCISVVRSHHERWDGKGYPDQLSNQNIPLLARLVAIADSFDAMTSSRSYRPALPAEEAYKRIIQGKGTQFDPTLVDAFKEVYPKWLEYLNS